MAWAAIVRLDRPPTPIRALAAAVVCAALAVLVGQLAWDIGEVDCTVF
ncbi:MAG TPA: hypothetical protein VIL04_12550 [Solirubrobacterales bacterium]